MIDRKTYLEMCQKVAALPSGVLGIKEKVPEDLKVVYDGVTYYPMSLEISFDKDGKVINTAILHSLKANSIVGAELKEVSVYEN
jgi:hypothetical protein